MAKWGWPLIMATLLALLVADAAVSDDGMVGRSAINESLLQKSVMLPQPDTEGGISLNEALKERRSIRTLKNDSLTLQEVSQLLWAAQGITDDKGHRTAGSAFEAYPLQIYVLAGNITDLSAGVYHFEPQNQSLIQLSSGDIRTEFAKVSVVAANAWIQTAPAIFLITGNFEKAVLKGADNSTVFTEAGLAAENLLLEVVSMHLASTYIAGFDPSKAADLLNLSPDETPIALLPVGQRR